jgi:hypothetical protein
MKDIIIIIVMAFGFFTLFAYGLIYGKEIDEWTRGRSLEIIFGGGIVVIAAHII